VTSANDTERTLLHYFADLLLADVPRRYWVSAKCSGDVWRYSYTTQQDYAYQGTGHRWSIGNEMMAATLEGDDPAHSQRSQVKHNKDEKRAREDQRAMRPGPHACHREKLYVATTDELSRVRKKEKPEYDRPKEDIEQDVFSRSHRDCVENVENKQQRSYAGGSPSPRSEAEVNLGHAPITAWKSSRHITTQAGRSQDERRKALRLLIDNLASRKAEFRAIIVHEVDR
jgi:hypothetical protein